MSAPSGQTIKGRYRGSPATVPEGYVEELLIDDKGRLVVAQAGTSGEGTYTVGTGTLQSAAVAVGNGSTFDVSGYATAVLFVSGTFVGTITFEATTDDTNWYPISATQLGTNTIATTATAPGLYRFSVSGVKTVRARVSSYTSGSITVTGRKTVISDAPRNQNVNMVENLAGEDRVIDVMKTEQRFTFGNISTATTTTIKSGQGFVHAINIIGGTLGAITVYDNTAGSGTTIIPTFTPTATLPNPSIVIDAAFGTGLTIVTAAATIIEVSYR